MERHILSKSTFIRGAQCLKSLYLYKKRYFLRDPLSAEQQAVFSRGTNVGILARQSFPGGKDATPPSPSLYSRSVSLTSEWIVKGVEVIYEAAFQFEKVLVALDIIVLTPDGWVGVEVKSSRAISETYILDAALQYYVITGSGLKLADIRIMHIDPDYLREGELVPEKLFKIQSVLEQVLEKQDYIRNQILLEKDAIEQNHSPDIPIGLHCHKPYTCDFIGHCWKNYSRPTVFELDAFSPELQQSLFDDGYYSPSELRDVFGLDTEQLVQVNSHLTGEIFLDKEALSQFIKLSEKPDAFLKVLYCRPAVPLFIGTRPYQELPFAFALIHNSPEEQSEYVIIPPAQYPNEEFFGQLKSRLEGINRVIVFGLNSELCSEFRKINFDIEILDLAELFRNKIIYHPSIASGMNISELTGFNERTKNILSGSIQNDTMAGVRYLALADALEGEAYSHELEQIKQFALQGVNEVAALINWLKEKAES
jgi:hypothetical protein